MINPNKLDCCTIYINNTEYEKINFFNKILNKYDNIKSTDVENIMLINAWNEWGEKMAIEPSNEYGFYYLNLINSLLT